MDNKKRAIILDMDETLEHGIFRSNYVMNSDGASMVLRPHLDKLIRKLQDAKSHGIDIVLCTTAKNPWVERFLALKPELRELFDKMLTKDNEDEWLYFDKEQNPLEYEAQQIDHNTVSTKPVTTFGYDSVLFIDDNSSEKERLKNLFQITQGNLQRHVTFFTGFGYGEGRIGLSKIFKYKKVAIQSPEISQKLEQYLATERNNPGCEMMCSLIDTFMNEDFAPGLTLADEQYSAQYDKFRKQLNSLMMELLVLEHKSNKETRQELSRYSDSELLELQSYLATDKKYPFEGIEIEQTEVDKREQLSGLVQTAISTQAKLDEAEKLESDYREQQAKETEL